MPLILNLFLEFMTGMKSNDSTGLDGNRLTGTWITPRARSLGSNLKVAKTGDFDVIAIHQALGHKVKKSVDHVLGLALIESNLVEKKLSQLGLGQGRGFQ